MRFTIDLTEYLTDQTLEETIQVLDELLLLIVLNAEETGLSKELSHQYMTIRNLRNTFIYHGRNYNSIQ